MAPRKTRERLEHDRRMLCRALRDYEDGAVAGVEPSEHDNIVNSIKRRIADLDSMIDQMR